MKSKPEVPRIFLPKGVGEIYYDADFAWIDFVTVFVLYWNLSFLVFRNDSRVPGLDAVGITPDQFYSISWFRYLKRYDVDSL
jgi:hypothetical protein